jgi:hypothetical protein
MDKLGKILYPRMDRWQRRRQIRTVFLAIFAGLILAGLVGLGMIFNNSR